jgi:hypothetical protein
MNACSFMYDVQIYDVYVYKRILVRCEQILNIQYYACIYTCDTKMYDTYVCKRILVRCDIILNTHSI